MAGSGPGGSSHRRPFGCRAETSARTARTRWKGRVELAGVAAHEYRCDRRNGREDANDSTARLRARRDSPGIRPSLPWQFPDRVVTGRAADQDIDRPLEEQQGRAVVAVVG